MFLSLFCNNLTGRWNKKPHWRKSVFGIIEHTAAITPSYNIETSGVFGVSHKSGEYAVSYYDFETAKLREIINLDGEFLSFVGDKERNRILIYSHGNPTNIYMYDVGINPKSLFKIETSDRDWYQKMELSPNGKLILIDCKQEGNKENSLCRLSMSRADSIRCILNSTALSRLYEERAAWLTRLKTTIRRQAMELASCLIPSHQAQSTIPWGGLSGPTTTARSTSKRCRSGEWSRTSHGRQAAKNMWKSTKKLLHGAAE